MFFKRLDRRGFIGIALTAAGITVLAYLLSLVLLTPMAFSGATVSALSGRNDFTFTDLYSQVADSRDVRAIDPDVVVINISGTERSDVAELLDFLTGCRQKALGIDVVFPEPSSNPEVDGLLISAMRRLPGAVLAECVDYDGTTVTERSFIADSLPACNAGAVNLPTNSDWGPVREFPVGYTLEDGSRLPGFAVAVASSYRPEALETLSQRGSSKETVNYVSREFEILTPRQLYDNPDAVTGKAVLIGTVDDESDLHPTPVSKAMPGVLIHAHAIATIVGGKYFHTVGNAVNWTIAFFLTFLVILFKLCVESKAVAFWMRVVQAALLIATIWTGYSLFLDRMVVVNFAYALLMVTFGFFACDLWTGFKEMTAPARQEIRRRYILSKNDNI